MANHRAPRMSRKFITTDEENHGMIKRNPRRKPRPGQCTITGGPSIVTGRPMLKWAATGAVFAVGMLTLAPGAQADEPSPTTVTSAWATTAADPTGSDQDAGGTDTVDGQQDTTDDTAPADDGADQQPTDDQSASTGPADDSGQNGSDENGPQGGDDTTGQDNGPGTTGTPAPSQPSNPPPAQPAPPAVPAAPAPQAAQTATVVSVSFDRIAADTVHARVVISGGDAGAGVTLEVIDGAASVSDSFQLNAAGGYNGTRTLTGDFPAEDSRIAYRFTDTVSGNVLNNGLGDKPLEGYQSNRLPQAKTVPPFSVRAGSSITFHVDDYFTDPDGDALNFTGASGAQHGTLTLSANGKTISYQPNDGYTGTDSFTLVASDGQASATNLVSGAVTPPSPNVLPQAVFVCTQVTDTLTLNCNGRPSFDLDGTVMTWHWTTDDGQTATTPETAFTYKTSGPHTVTLVVTDNRGADSLPRTIPYVLVPVVTPPTPDNPVVTAAAQGCTGFGRTAGGMLSITNPTDGAGTDNYLVSGLDQTYAFQGGPVTAADGETVSYTVPVRYRMAGSYEILIQDLAKGTATTVNLVIKACGPTGGIGLPGGGTTNPVGQPPQGDTNTPQPPANNPSYQGGALANTGPIGDLEMLGLLGLTVVAGGVGFTIIGRQRRVNAS